MPDATRTRKPIRVLHTSDVHLGPANYDPTGRQHVEGCLCPIEVITDLVTEHHIDLLLIAGDLFDHGRVPDELVADTFSLLAKLPCEVVLLAGNHDVYDDRALYRRHREVIDAAGVVLFDDPDGSTHDLLDGAMRMWARAMEDHTPSFQPLLAPAEHPDDRWYVVGGHGQFTEEGGDPYRSSRISVGDLNATGADYIALGHWHLTTDLTTRGVSLPAWYCGAPLFGHGAGNVLIVDFDDAATQPVLVQPIRVLDHPLAICVSERDAALTA